MLLCVRIGGFKLLATLALKQSFDVPVEVQEEISLLLKERLYNASMNCWNDLVPHSPFCNLPIKIPTSWDISQSRYVQLSSDGEARRRSFLCTSLSMITFMTLSIKTGWRYRLQDADRLG